MTWNRFPHYWPFVRGTTDYRWIPLKKGQWCRPLMFLLMSAWTNCYRNSREAGELECSDANLASLWPRIWCTLYNDIIMSTMAHEITRISTVGSAVCWGAHHRKYQSSPLLAFVRGIHQGSVDFPHKGPVTRKMFPFDDVIMVSVLSGYIVNSVGVASYVGSVHLSYLASIIHRPDMNMKTPFMPVVAVAFCRASHILLCMSSWL